MAHSRVANQLRQIREDRGLTQEHLAGLVGLSRQSIISLESGRFLPSIETALRLSSILEIPLEKIFWLKESNR